MWHVSSEMLKMLAALCGFCFLKSLLSSLSTMVKGVNKAEVGGCTVERLFFASAPAELECWVEVL